MAANNEDNRFSEVQPVSGGNMYEFWMAQNVNNQIINSNLQDILDEMKARGVNPQVTNSMIVNLSGIATTINEVEIPQWYLFEYQTNYYANTIKFETEDSDIFYKTKKMIRHAFQNGAAVLFKYGDTVCIGGVDKINEENGVVKSYDIYYIPTFYNTQLTEEMIKRFKRVTIDKANVALFMWSNSTITNWKTIYSFCKLQQKLLNMITVDCYSNIKKYNYKVINPGKIQQELDNYFNEKLPVIMSPDGLDFENKLEPLDLRNSSNNPNSIVEMYKQVCGVYNAIFGRRTNNDFKKERSVTQEISLTSDNYEILEQEWIDNFKLFCKDAKDNLGITITFIEEENTELGGDEDYDIQRVQDTKSK